MVILDFSGTLSLDMALYSRPANLTRALKQSGLWHLGVTTPEIFWDELVNPTWTAGSTTASGYKRLMADRVASLAAPGEIPPAAEVIWASVSKFVDDYLAQAVIDPAWRPVLQTLLAQPDAQVVVATDHYAEATPAIVSHLQAAGVEAGSIREAGAGPGQVAVANSADIGHHKASRDFWRAVQQALKLEAVRRVLIIDDFGFNEQSFDQYADQQKIIARMQQTVEILAEVFEARSEAFPFFLRSQARNDSSGDVNKLRQDYRELVKQAGRFIDIASP